MSLSRADVLPVSCVAPVLIRGQVKQEGRRGGLGKECGAMLPALVLRGDRWSLKTIVARERYERLVSQIWKEEVYVRKSTA